MFVSSLLVRKGLQIFIGFFDDDIAFFCNGQNLFDVVHQSVVLLALLLVLEGSHRIDINLLHLYILYGIPVLQGFSHFHHRHEGWCIHVHLSVFGVNAVVFLCQCHQGDG